MKKTVLIAFGLLALLLVGRFLFSLASQPSDETLILQALDEAILASREGRPGGVLDLISSDFRVNDQQEISRRQVIDAVKKSRPKIEVMERDVLVSGEEARIDSAIRATANFLGIERSFNLNEVSLQFRQESDREWLIIPVKKWRLHTVFVPESAYADMVGQF
jgi:hypothetical protein